MRGVTFGTKHSYNDYALMLEEPPVVSPPAPREKWVVIPGKNGALNLSKVQTGKMQYEMRTISMRFVYIGPREGWASVYSQILNYMHGKDLHITLDDDPNYYYDGIVKIAEYKPEKAHFGLAVTCTVQPKKFTLSGSNGGF